MFNNNYLRKVYNNGSVLSLTFQFYVKLLILGSDVIFIRDSNETTFKPTIPISILSILSKIKLKKYRLYYASPFEMCEDCNDKMT